MQVSLAPAEGLKRQITVSIPAERVQSDYDKKFNKIKQSAKLDGFRPGKVPNHVVESRFGASIHQEVISDLIRETLFEAMKQEDLNPIGMPNITNMKADKGEAMEYVAEFEVMPEVQLKTLSGVDVEKTTGELTEDDLTTVLERLRKQRVEWVEVSRTSKNGDQVTIDFDGTVEGEPLQGGKAKETPLELGSGSMIPGFEDGIVGMKAGEEKTIDVTFPEEYHAKEIAGKKAQFKITVHKVCEPKLPELNDAFAEAFGVKEGGIEALKADMKKHMEAELENGLKMINKSTVFDQLLSQNTFDVPEAAVEQEMENMHKQSQQYVPEDKQSALTDEARDYLREPAARRVRLGVLIAEVIKQKDLKADPEKVKEMVMKMSGSYESPEEFMQWFMADKSRLQQIEAVVLEDSVAELLMNEANASEKKMSYDEISQAQHAAQRGF